jgi:hypothetical protein
MKCIQYGNTYRHDSNNIDFTLKKLVILLIKHYEVLFSPNIMHNRLYDVGAVVTDLLDRSQMFCIPNITKKNVHIQAASQFAQARPTWLHVLCAYVVLCLAHSTQWQAMRPLLVEATASTPRRNFLYNA